MTSFWKEVLGCWWPGLLLAGWSPGAGVDGCALAGLWSALVGLVDTDLTSWLLWSAPTVGVVTASETLLMLPGGKVRDALLVETDPSPEVPEVWVLPGLVEETGELGEEEGCLMTNVGGGTL